MDSANSRDGTQARVTKLDVVRRQLAAAIGLFFAESDAIAVHTLVAAAHQILVDLGQRKGIQSVVKNASKMTTPETRQFLLTLN